MRPKSVEKFKDKVRDLTIRKHNLELRVITDLNRVIRGTANYFGTSFSTSDRLFKALDPWIRMRLRCMKFKRKSQHDNKKLRLKTLRKRGLLSLRDIWLSRVKERRATPRLRQALWGRPVWETHMLDHMVN